MLRRGPSLRQILHSNQMEFIGSDIEVLCIGSSCHFLCIFEFFWFPTYFLFKNNLQLAFILFFFNWKIITLQCYTGLCHTTVRTSHNYVYIVPPSSASLPPTYLLGSVRVVISLHAPKLYKTKCLAVCRLWNVTHSVHGIFVACLFGMGILRSPCVTPEGSESPVTDPQRPASVVNEGLLSPAFPTVPLTRSIPGGFQTLGPPWRELHLASVTFLLSPQHLGVKTNSWAGIHGKTL